MALQQELINDRTVGLVRNALLVAGQEMGETGDHWPVINATIHAVMRDYEQAKIERNVQAEMKKHLYAQLDDMQRRLPELSATDRADAEPKLAQIREIYDAHFTPIGHAFAVLSDDETPAHVARAENIIMWLEGEEHDDAA